MELLYKMKTIFFIGSVALFICACQKVEPEITPQTIVEKVEDGMFFELPFEERLKELEAVDYLNSSPEEISEIKSQAVLVWQNENTNALVQYKAARFLAECNFLDNNFYDSLAWWRIADKYDCAESDCAEMIKKITDIIAKREQQ